MEHSRPWARSLRSFLRKVLDAAALSGLWWFGFPPPFPPAEDPEEPAEEDWWR